jgi:hypothetical protein
MIGLIVSLAIAGIFLLFLIWFILWTKKRKEAIELLNKIKKVDPAMAKKTAEEYGAIRATLVHFTDKKNIYKAEYILIVFLERRHIEYTYRSSIWGWELESVKK